jgi:hypothetical protein
MALGAQCAENGPFFSTTPRAVIQNGMAISQDILIMPDWLLIGLMMASLLLLMIILVIGLVRVVIFISIVSYYSHTGEINTVLDFNACRTCDNILFSPKIIALCIVVFYSCHQITFVVNIPKTWLEEDSVYIS